MQLLPFYFGTKLIVIPQIPFSSPLVPRKYLHGLSLNSTFIDCWSDVRSLEIKAPMDCTIVYYHKEKDPHMDNFVVQLDGYKAQLIFVHSKPSRMGKFKAGEVLGYSTWSHWHFTVCFGATPSSDPKYSRDPREFFDPSILIVDTNAPTIPLGEWSNVKRDLNDNLLNNNTPMVQAIYMPELHRITSLRTQTRIRLEPNTKSDVIGFIQEIGYSWQTNCYAIGEVIEGNNKWWQVLVPIGQDKAGTVGYVTASFFEAVKITADCSIQNAEIIKLNAELTKLNTKIINAKGSAQATVVSATATVANLN